MTKPWPLAQTRNAALRNQMPGHWLCNVKSCCRTERRLQAADGGWQTCKSSSTPAIVIESDEVQAWLVTLLVLGCIAQGRLPRVCASPAG